MMSCILRRPSKRPVITALSVFVSGLLLGACARRDELPYHVMQTPVHGQPQSVFVDPVGRGYPELVQRTFPKFDPLPTVRRPFATRPSEQLSPVPSPVPAPVSEPPSVLPQTPNVWSAPPLRP